MCSTPPVAKVKMRYFLPIKLASYLYYHMFITLYKAGKTIYSYPMDSKLKTFIMRIRNIHIISPGNPVSK